ncbi:MAG: hypothetical protein KF781_03230 [Chitinophagaceae bacterium]|nr:hypothetical protein [Chitinophagaceae bacterium]MCW5904525.1 hypothetical protein [Chitinophagaceae bacterium]
MSIDIKATTDKLGTLTLSSYIIFFTVKKFGNNELLYFIPMLLSFVALILIIRFIASCVRKNIALKFRKNTWLYIQLVSNILLIGMCFLSLLINK